MNYILAEKNYFIHTSFVDSTDTLRPFAIWELFQAVAASNAKEAGAGYEDLLKLNLLWVVAYQEFKIVGRVPKYSDIVRVVSWPHPKTRLEFTREYEMYDSNNNLCICGISSWFTVDKDTHKLTKGDNVSFNNDNYYPKTNYPGFRRRKLNLDPVGNESSYKYKILLTDLDHNGHTNNAKYFDIVYNLGITKIKDIKSGAISFIKEANLGEELIIKYFKNIENNDCYIGYLENNEVSFQILFEV